MPWFVANTFGTEVEQLANALYERLDWTWMLTNGGELPDKLWLSHGWKPEEGFLPYNWDSYCELMLLYLLGLGAPSAALPAACWAAWRRPVVEYKGYRTLFGGPLFVHQMAHGFYNFAGQRDPLGWNYWETSQQATLLNRQFCLDHMDQRRTYALSIWGLNAGDYPGGYKAFGAPGEEDGTVSPSGAIGSLPFTPVLATQAAQSMYQQYGSQIWGRYGFANAFNVDQQWYGADVIGIDLGMLLLSLENVHSGLIWRLLASHPATVRAWQRAGFQLSIAAVSQP